MIRNDGIKVLVSIPLSNAREQHKNDFVLTRPGELLVFIKSPPGSFADDESGVARSFVGVTTGNRTTVARVEFRPIAFSAYERMVYDYYCRANPDLAINYRKKAFELTEKTMALIKDIRAQSVVGVRDDRLGIR